MDAWHHDSVPAQLFRPAHFAAEHSVLATLARGCVVRGETRRGGEVRVANYVNGHCLVSDPHMLSLCSTLLHAAIKEHAPDAAAVVGEVTAACALVSGVVLRSAETPRPLMGRFLRKEPKTYGIPGLLNTPLEPPGPVVLVDDVAATGTTGERSIQVLRHLGLDVLGMFVLVDRGEIAANRLAALGVPLIALFRLDELVQGRTED